jgi:cob(I)alamin adenosyltransferase
MQSLRAKSLLLLLTLLTACSSKSSADDLTKELETVTSWAATAQMVGDAWSQGNVPTVYAQQTLSQAQQKLHQETDTLAQSSTSTQRHYVLEQLQRLESTVGQMSTAVEQKDRVAMSQHLKQLSTQEQTLSTLAKTVGGH